eukprot:gb/GECG01014437.1/.p1 GENE.gb/GECG01014437.1/~~gb/GECG01014437.1/.p1  ORF type:complete len:610 (+),score=108.28 gb/GECG01014437.1/:1-1830(+)
MLRNKAEEFFKRAKDTIQNKSETEKKLDEILSKKEWGASTTQMNEIARLTHDPMEYRIIMSAIWESLDEDGKNWRVILKALTLLEHLVKLGSERVIDDARSNLFRVRMYNDFTYRDEMGHDRGGGIREKASYLREILHDTARIREEREKARQLQKKFVGVAGKGGSIGYQAGSSRIGGGIGSSGLSDYPAPRSRYGLDAPGFSDDNHRQHNRNSGRSTSNTAASTESSSPSGRRGRKPHRQRKAKEPSQSPESDHSRENRNRNGGGKMNIKFQQSPQIKKPSERKSKAEEEFSPFDQEEGDEFDPFEEPAGNTGHVQNGKSGDDFDPFEQPGSNVSFEHAHGHSEAVNDTAPQNELDDVFASPPASTPAQTNDAFDPFSGPANAGGTTGGSGSMNPDPFGSPPSHGQGVSSSAHSGSAIPDDLFADAPTNHAGNAAEYLASAGNDAASGSTSKGSGLDDEFDGLVSLDLNEEPTKKGKDTRKQGPTMASMAKSQHEKRPTGLEGSAPQQHSMASQQHTPMQPHQAPMYPPPQGMQPQYPPMYAPQYGGQMPPQGWGGPPMQPQAYMGQYQNAPQPQYYQQQQQVPPQSGAWGPPPSQGGNQRMDFDPFA